MAATYATAQQVKDFLTTQNVSAPSDSVIADRIEEAEEEIESYTGHAWKSITVSNEYHEVDNTYGAGTGAPVFLTHRSVRTFSHDSGDKLEIWDGSQWKDWLADSAYIEGRNNDYWARYEDGIVYVRRTYRYPIGLRATYRYGESAVPKIIRKAAILLSACDIVDSDNQSVVLPEGTSASVPYADKVKRWREQAYKILQPYMEFRIPTK